MERMSFQNSRQLFRVLKHLYPRDFREAYGAEMEVVFLASLRAQVKRRGALGVPYSWIRVTWDTLVHSIGERVGSGAGEPGRRGSQGGAQRPSSPTGGPTGSRLLEALLSDLRQAFRALARTPLFVATTVLSLTVGILVSTAMFSVVNATLFRPPRHVTDPEEVVKVILERPSSPNSRSLFSYPDFLDLEKSATTVEGLAAVRPEMEYTVRVGSDIDRRMLGEMVSENYFDLLGIRMALGRGFLVDDVERGAVVAVIGHRVWLREYGGDPAVLGQVLRVDGQPHTIVGVAPEGVPLLSDIPADGELWLPIPAEYREERSAGFVYPVARRLAGVTTARVEAEFRMIAERLAEEYPEAWGDGDEGPLHLRVLTHQQSRIPFGDSVFPVVALYLIVNALIMLIVCSNVASLLLARALSRRAEIAVRLALGARRRRLIGQLLTESLVLFGMAGGLSLVLIHWVTRLIRTGIGPIPLALDYTVDGRVIAFTAGLTVVSGLVFGLVPALQASRPHPTHALKGMHASNRFRRFGVRNLLVLSQVTGSLVLVILTALLVRGIRLARAIDIGFDPHNVAVLSLDLSQRDYDRDTGPSFLDDLTERVSGLPGVEAVAVATEVPLSGWLSRMSGFRPEGYESTPDEALWATYNAVSPGYFDLVRMPLLGGRDFGTVDDADAPGVVIVNETFARRFWPDEEAVGKRVALDPERPPAAVIGVVRDAKYWRVNEAPELHVWIPRSQGYRNHVEVLVRTRGNPTLLFATLRDQVQALDRELPIIEMRSMESITAQATLGQRITAGVFGGTGIVSLLLAIVGIYGVMAYSVAQRTREMGIRMAVGSPPIRVVGMVVTESLGLTAAGFGVGLILAAAAARLVKSMLFGVSPLDPLSFAGSLALLVLSAVGASLVPALRAARVDPVLSLKSE